MISGSARITLVWNSARGRTTANYGAGMELSASEFYDGWAFEYDLIFSDWWSFASASGAALATRLETLGVASGSRILDCTAGIGTQAIPLAQLGYAVTATDISSQSIERARLEAGNRKADLETKVLDVTALGSTSLAGFAAVVSYGNSLPHLRTDEELDLALAGMRGALAPGGYVVIAIRDYAALIEQQPTGTPGVFVEDDRGTRVYGQAWQWSADLQTLSINVFMLQNSTGEAWDTTMRTTTYRTLTRDELTKALQRAGFVEIQWHEPDQVDPNQPVVTAQRG